MVAAAADLPCRERVFPGTGLTWSLVRQLLIKYAGPADRRRGTVSRSARNHSREEPLNHIDAVFTALSEQTVTMIGTEAVELVLPRIARQIKELKHQRGIVAEDVEGFSMIPLFTRSGRI